MQDATEHTHLLQNNITHGGETNHRRVVDWSVLNGSIFDVPSYFKYRLTEGTILAYTNTIWGVAILYGSSLSLPQYCYILSDIW